MTFEEIYAIVQEITYKPGIDILCKQDAGGRAFVQISVGAENDLSLSPFTGKHEPWKSGKHYLSEFMCRQEIVGSVFGAIRNAEEHEMKEWFRYKGASIYNPHLDPDVLALIAKKKASFNLRKNAMSMEE